MKDKTVKTAPVYHPYRDIWEELCQEMDRVVITPVQLGGSPDPYKLDKMFQRFGTYESMKEQIDECLSDESYYKGQYEDLEMENDDLEQKIKDMQETIRDIVSDMEHISELDTEGYPDGQMVISNNVAEGINSDIQDAIKALDKLVDDDWKPGSKKKGKK